MTEDGFRRLALSLPEAVEGAHHGHADFRVGGKVFATLGYPEPGCGMIKLTPELQQSLVAAEPKIFVPVPGGWGRQGATNVRLRAATRAKLLRPMTTAWRRIAPKRLAAEFED